MMINISDIVLSKTEYAPCTKLKVNLDIELH